MLWSIIGLLISLAPIVVFFVGLYGVFNPKPFKNSKTGKVPSRLVMLGFAIFIPIGLIILSSVLLTKIVLPAAATPTPPAIAPGQLK